MPKATYVIRQNIKREYYFVLRAANNEVILTSEGYTARHNALGGIEAVRINAPHDERYDRRTSKSDEPYFVLKGGNHEILGTSEMYSSVGKRDQGIEAVKKFGPIAEVVEG